MKTKYNYSYTLFFSTILLLLNSFNSLFAQDSLKHSLFVSAGAGAGITCILASPEYDIRENTGSSSDADNFLNQSWHSLLSFKSFYLLGKRWGIEIDIEKMYESISNIYPTDKANPSGSHGALNHANLKRFEYIQSFDFQKKILQSNIGVFYKLNSTNKKLFYISSLICFGFNLTENERYTYYDNITLNTNYLIYGSLRYVESTNKLFYLDRVLIAFRLGNSSPLDKKNKLYINTSIAYYSLPFSTSNKRVEDISNGKLGINLDLSYRFK